MSGTKGRWSDLGPRVGSAVVMISVGFAAILAGGLVFNVFVAAICGVMVWELSRMLAPEEPAVAVQSGLVAGAAILLANSLPPLYVLPVLLAPAVAGATRLKQNQGLFLVYAALIALAGNGLAVMRVDLGVPWVLWLIGVVIASDVAAYFAGKSLGGPKLWPRVSPNKTWAGAVGGWAGAALVGFLYATWGGFGLGLVLFSIAMAMMGQAGDIAESALKRKVGVKDSSALIPGHGGLMDRFDALLGAALFAGLARFLLGLPAGLI